MLVEVILAQIRNEGGMILVGLLCAVYCSSNHVVSIRCTVRALAERRRAGVKQRGKAEGGELGK